MYAMTIKGRSAKELQTVVSRLLGRYNTPLPHSILSPHPPSRLSTVSTLPTPPPFHCLLARTRDPSSGGRRHLARKRAAG